jgi:gas vesicle protein
MESRRRNGSFGTFLLGALFGATAGALTALLLTPQSGEEMQTEIRNKALELKQSADNRISEGQQQLQSQLRKGKNTMAELLEQSAEILQEDDEKVIES